MSAPETDPVAEGRDDEGHDDEGHDDEGRHVAPEDKQPQGPLRMVTAAVREVVVVVAMALVLSFIVKTWLLQAFFIPSGSMEDTLLVGDRVIVVEADPGPVDLKHGDVVVFQDPGGWLEVAAARAAQRRLRGRSTTGWCSSACCRPSPRTTSSSGSSACPATTWCAARRIAS